MAEEFENRVNIGAKFYKSDLAIFTPASPYYSGEPVESQEMIVKKYLDVLLEKGIKVIGLADENLGLEERNGYYWQNIFLEKAKEREITVFPGFSVTTQEKKKIIILFDPQTSVKELNDFLTSLGLKENERFYHNNNPIPLQLNLEELLRKTKEKEVICLEVYKKGSISEQISPYINGIISEEFEEGGFRTIGVLKASFAHNPQDVGKNFTFLKMGVPNIEGLRLALLDWEMKLRYDEESIKAKHPKILNIKWEGGFLDGIEINLNRGFNALIGGRGTGKTTIIETIRYGLGLFPKTKRNIETQEQILKEVFRPGSKITLTLESEEPPKKRYIVKRVYPFKPAVFDADTHQKIEVSPKDIFGAEIYGSKEIYEISKKSDFQRELIIERCKKDLLPLEDEKRKLQKEYYNICQEILKYKKEIIRQEEETAKMPSVREKLRKFEELGVPEKIAEKRKIETERFIFDKGEEIFDNLAKKFTEFITDLSLTMKEVKTHDVINKELIEKEKELINSTFETIENTIHKVIDILKERKKLHCAQKDKWINFISNLEEEYKNTLRKLQDTYPGVDIEEFVNLEKELKRLKDAEENLQGLKRKLSMLTEDKEKIVNKIKNCRERIKEVLQKNIKKWNEKLLGKLRIELEEKDKDELKVAIKEIFPSIPDELLSFVAENFEPIELARFLKTADERRLEEKGLSPLMKYYPEIRDEERMLKLESLDYHPKITFYLNLGTKEVPNYVKIDRLSDGQRCSAILEFLLLSKEFPLIIDQPEEDLDNPYIVETIVEKLRKEKDVRQFIIATHNANLPLLGDADLIIALEADMNRAYLREGNYGYLDSPKVKELSEKLLEGGREAFKMRKEKYGK